MKFFKAFFPVVLAAFIVSVSSFVKCQDSLLIVTDPWPPYSVEKNQVVSGSDVEIVQAVFKQMNIPVVVQSIPWSRCQQMVKNKTADAILDVSLTPEREKFLFFPKEPVSYGVTVFFIKKGSKINFTGLDDLDKYIGGALLGYSYCDEIDHAKFMKKVERVSRLEQNFNKLLAGRIDFLIEVDAVGFSKAKEMGILDQIDIIDQAKYCRGGNYLAFAQKKGYEQMSIQFDLALKAFKQTEAYQDILQRHWGKIPGQRF